MEHSHAYQLYSLYYIFCNVFRIQVIYECFKYLIYNNNIQQINFGFSFVNNLSILLYAHKHEKVHNKCQVKF